MRSLNLSLFITAHARLDSETVQVKTKIDSPGPTTTLHRTSSRTKFVEKIAEAEMAAQSEGQTDTSDDQADKEQR